MTSSIYWAACKLLLSCRQTASRFLLETCCRAGGKLLLKLRVSKAIFWLRFGLVFGLVRNLWSKTYLGAQFKCTGWLRQNHLGNLMLCLKKSTVWPQKVVAEILSWDVNQNPVDLLPKHTWIMRLHGVLISKNIVLFIIFHSLKPMGRLALAWYFAHLGEGVGVTFLLSSWGA